MLGLYPESLADNPVSDGEAGDEARTRDPQLGKLMLYQLSYAREARILAARLETQAVADAGGQHEILLVAVVAGV